MSSTPTRPPSRGSEPHQMLAVVQDATTPHDECELTDAKKRAVLRIDRRTVSDPTDIPAHDGDEEWWYSDGYNHRVTVDGIERDFPDRVMTVPVDSLAELWMFITEAERTGRSVRVSIG